MQSGRANIKDIGVIVTPSSFSNKNINHENEVNKKNESKNDDEEVTLQSMNFQIGKKKRISHSFTYLFLHFLPSFLPSYIIGDYLCVKIETNHLPFHV